MIIWQDGKKIQGEQAIWKCFDMTMVKLKLDRQLHSKSISIGIDFLENEYNQNALTNRICQGF